MQTLTQVPRDHSWSLLVALDHVHEDDVSEALAVMRQMPSIEWWDTLQWDVAFSYSNTDNGDLAAVFDGEAEEWNRTLDQIGAWR